MKIIRYRTKLYEQNRFLKLKNLSLDYSKDLVLETTLFKELVLETTIFKELVLETTLFKELVFS